MSDDHSTRQRKGHKSSDVTVPPPALKDLQGGKGEQHGLKDLHADELLHKGEVMAKDAYNRFCDTCGQLKGSPKLMTVLLLLSAFALGIGVTAMAGRMGYFAPSTGHFTRDRTYVEAHAALDTLLGNYHDMKDKAGNVKDAMKWKVAKESWDNARERLIDVMAHKAKDWSWSAMKTGAAAKMAGLVDSAMDTKANLGDKISAKYHELKGDVEPTLGEKIEGHFHDARDALNDAYYKAKGKVMGKKEEIKEHPIKSQLHKAENKIKDAIHAAGNAMHLG